MLFLTEHTIIDENILTGIILHFVLNCVFSVGKITIWTQEMFTPQFPDLFNNNEPVENSSHHHLTRENCCYYNLCKQYSLLSYITSSNNSYQSACAPNTSGFVVVPELPAGSLIAVGAMMRHMIVVPEEDLVIVTMSSATAVALNCTGMTNNESSHIICQPMCRTTYIVCLLLVYIHYRRDIVHGILSSVH